MPRKKKQSGHRFAWWVVFVFLIGVLAMIVHLLLLFFLNLENRGQFVPVDPIHAYIIVIVAVLAYVLVEMKMKK